MDEDALRPSFFEYIAEQYFVDALHPALNYALGVLAGKFRWARWGLQRSDELFFGSLTLVNAHYIALYGATFAENFYGLCRDEGERGGGGERGSLSQRARIVSLASSVIVPYVRAKVERWFEPYEAVALEHGAVQVSPARAELDRSGPVWKRACVVAYPWLNSAFEAANLLFMVLYLYRRTEYFSLPLRLARLRLVRLSPDDVARQDEASTLSRAKLWERGSASIVGRLVLRVLFGGMDAAQYALPVSVFVFRFADWWNSPENEALRGGSAEPARMPGPPPQRPVAAAVVELPADPNVCPVCREVRTNPAVGPSGFVCCYPCVFVAARDTGKCPVSGAPLTVEQIIKVY